MFTSPISIRSGWRIVAVEQAGESVPLQDFVFPPKTLLLLGKEREGVPVELLNKVQLSRIRNPKIHCHLRWMIVWRSPRVGWSVPSTSMSPGLSSSGRRSSSCPSFRRYLDFGFCCFMDIRTLSFSRSCLNEFSCYVQGSQTKCCYSVVCICSGSFFQNI